MKKISSDAHDAFINNRRFKSSNTEVTIEDGEVAMYLFGNKIAKKENDEIFISAGGHVPSRTTRDRLNAFTEIWLSIKGGQWMVDRKVYWDGKWASINVFKD